MSRVVELNEGLSKDPAYRLEFTKTREDMVQVTSLLRGKAGGGAVAEQAPGRTRPVAGGASLRKRSA